MRQEPRDRSRLEGLCGIIHVTLLSESYIHVGSFSSLFTVDEKMLTNLIKSGERDIRGLQRAAKFMEVAQFSTSGGRPVIPGSTIKGNVRSRLELSFRARNNYVRSCFIRARGPLLKETPKGGHGWRHFRVWSNVLFEERGPPCDLTKMDKVCLICDLFGTSGLKSLIDYGDLVGEKDAKNVLEQFSLEYGMNLFAAKPNSKFSGRIIFRNLSPSDLGLLLIGMKVGKEALLGRLKYRHKVSGYTFGKVKYDVETIRFLEESCGFEAGGVKVRGGDLINGSELANLLDGLRSLTHEEFKDEIVEVDEVAIIEQVSRG